MSADEELRRCRDLLGRLSSELALAEERERRVLAEHLHDHVGQGLAHLRQRLLALRDRVQFSGLEEDLNELVDLSARIIQSTRTLSFDLSPPVLYDLGLAEALDWLAERHDGQNGARVTFLCHGRRDCALPRDRRVLVYTSVRELLINSLTHGAPHRVVLLLSGDAEGVTAEVKDDGRGFEPRELSARGRPEGYGLFSIRERAAALGGFFEIRSGAGLGARATMRIPREKGSA
ncbi:MAG: histidine kinase [bacterium]|nr:histidine kinase [bacterium]